MDRPWRSWLYVPATRPERVAKALAGAADCVVIDLEDSVVPDRKAQAREITVGLLRTRPAKPVVVRINDLSGPWGWDDLTAVATSHAAGIRVPKVTDPALVRRAADQLRRSGSVARLFLLVESAQGVERAYDLVTADELIAGVSLGEADLRADLRVEADEGLWYARSRIVTAARAAGLAPPVQSAYVQLNDEEGLRQTSRLGRQLGFFGRSVIHPAQVPVVHEAFMPSAAEVAAARELVEALNLAREEGSGVLTLDDGRFVDVAVVEAARWTLAIAGQENKSRG